jgi:hypothetical protein
MKKHTPIIVIFIFAAIGLVIYLFKDKITSWFKPKAAGDTPPATQVIKEYHTETIYNNGGGGGGNNDNEVPPITDLDKDKVLKRGSKNDEVKHLQSLINTVLKAKKKVLLTADGSFGPKTENALYFLIKKKQTTLSQFATIMVQTKGKGL